MRRRIYIFAVLAVFFAISLYSQQPSPKGSGTTPVSVEAALDSGKLLMGERIGLKLRVKVPSDTSRVDFPLLNQLKGKRYVSLLNDTIEIVNDYFIDTVKAGKDIYINYNLLVQSFDSGRYELPPFDLIVDGTKVQSNTVTLEVLPVKVKADDEIDKTLPEVIEAFDLLPDGLLEEESDSNVWIIWLIIGCGLILCVLVYLFFRYRKSGTILRRAKHLTPYEQAVSQLRKLEKQKLWEKGKTKEYYTKLTAILRRYLRNQFGIKTLERTSTQILEDIENDPHLKEYLQSLTEIFTLADYVKFAKENPTAEENVGVMRKTRYFIDNSRPIEEENEKVKGKEVRNDS